MEVLTIIVLLLVGGVLGFIASKFISPSSIQAKKLATQVSESETALAQYKLDVAEHLDQSASLLAQMNDTCQKAMLQMEQSTKLLQQVTPNDLDAMPFFSKETQEQLAQTVSLRHEKKEKAERKDSVEPPLDYSGEATGLFADKKQTVTNAEVGN
ncbi:ZapG family protein [Thalassotalea piscium]|uniref:Z-ring associated protein G n=1 Tax=Thalassotalea piscium TaxID=1230533 RepID=A0A7X0TU55_9GAMM|nr:DUF1043 family protein [Thalassotalea piscium]MBB6543735.1 hypothetical protein [Thalassotalea piscium]